MRDNITVEEARKKAMQLCSRRECCRREAFERIASWGCPPAEAGKIVDFLVEHKFVDDGRYAKAFVMDKLRFNGWGRVKTAGMLRAQNIDGCMIAAAMSEIDEDEYNRILTGELQKKIRTVKKNSFETREKLFRFAVGRGFEPDLVSEKIAVIAGGELSSGDF